MNDVPIHMCTMSRDIARVELRVCFHQTLKRWLTPRPRPTDVNQLQTVLDTFRARVTNILLVAVVVASVALTLWLVQRGGRKG
jgi:hypothetical protein